MTTERILDRRKGERREVTPHQEYLEERLRTFFAKCLAIFAVLGITTAVALLGFGIVLGKQKDLTHQIQVQRFESLLQGCIDTNQRNVAVNQQIDSAIAKLPPKGRSQAKEKAKPFRLILEAAVPYTPNCFDAAMRRTKGESPDR